MNNDNFEFWKMAFDMKAIDITLLRQAVITEKNPYGDLTKEQFKEISQEDFENIPSDN
ncbi:XkdX family protein [Clostridium baratii]|uniref:XkdX family protein n=1 Tax=Clostridium baratii TaxID=1561 RepID=UPI0030D1D89C